MHVICLCYLGHMIIIPVYRRQTTAGTVLLAESVIVVILFSVLLRSNLACALVQFPPWSIWWRTITFISWFNESGFNLCHHHEIVLYQIQMLACLIRPMLRISQVFCRNIWQIQRLAVFTYHRKPKDDIVVWVLLLSNFASAWLSLVLMMLPATGVFAAAAYYWVASPCPWHTSNLCWRVRMAYQQGSLVLEKPPNARNTFLLTQTYCWGPDHCNL